MDRNHLLCFNSIDSFPELNHKPVLEKAGINYEDLNRCKNWCIIILELSQVRIWRKNHKTTKAVVACNKHTI